METRETNQLEKLLHEAHNRGASDLFLLAGEPPIFRVHGELERADCPPLSGDDTQAIAYASAGSDLAGQIGKTRGDIVTHCGVEGVVEGRMCIIKAMGEYSEVIRLLPCSLPEPEKCRIPQALLDAVMLPSGMVVVAGETGSGKSTTALMLLEHLNRNRTVHIRTIEDPICVRLQPKKAVIGQQEVGTDTPSTIDGLKTVLALDPDVIYVHEVRNLPELEACVTAAAMGHMVITVLHSATPKAALERMIDVQPDDLRPVFRKHLAAVLRAVSAQRLLPVKSGPSRIAAYGLLIVDDEMRQAIAQGKDVLERKTPLPPGCQTMQDDIRKLLAEGKVAQQAAQEAIIALG